jgi:4-alpha-glucanotransferase
MISLSSKERVMAQRRSGVLLPVSALLKPGAGALGDPARRFIDWLSTAGFSVWQVLPLVPVDQNGSPYWARSDRAGNPALLDSDAHDPGTEDDFADFRAAARWLRDYALFEALGAEQEGAPWWRWPASLRDRDPDALARAEKRLAPAIDALAREQWRFDAQWRALRLHADARNVRIFGDLPIYVAPDSVATWTAREQFALQASGEVAEVAGVPPDYFSADGQLWGNPLYDWERQKRDGFAFWLQRLGLQADRFDLLRIDHFRALAAYWAVPTHATTAREGIWRDAPGRELLLRVTSELPQLELVAEDLGVITPDVTALRQDFSMPGMRVVQFGFDGDPANPHLPHQHEVDSVIYTGTHDNDTTRGWYESLTPFARDLVRRYLGRPDSEVVDSLCRCVLGSVGRLAVLPAQDLLELGSEARLNRPGTVSGNWSWRLPMEALTQSMALRYRDLNQLYNRSVG